MDTPKPGMVVVDSGVEDGVAWVTCLMRAFGAVNGYVKIPAGHPYADHGDDEYAEILTLAHDYAHGGLTYARGEWIGFDTVHAGDWWPGTVDLIPALLLLPDRREWTPELVAAETRRLAQHVAAVGRAAGEITKMADGGGER
jgi:hypothetical protein